MQNEKNLSPRLAQLVVAISYGKSRKQIAFEMGLSINTIKTYITRVYQKVGAVNAPDCIRILFEEGYLKNQGI